MIISSLLAVILALSISNTGANLVQTQQVRQPSSSVIAYDKLCNKVMCIEAEVEDEVARYTLSSTGALELGWMALGFGRIMGDSAMVIMWPERDAEDGTYVSVTLSQRKAPFETMPMPDPDPPFVAALDLATTSVTEEHLQMGFTRPAPPGGMQNIIWAFSRTPPDSAGPDANISIHHEFGRTRLNLTRTAILSDDDAVPPSSEEGEDEDAWPSDSDTSSEESTSPADGATTVTRIGGFAGFLHAGLCMGAFLVVIPSGALVVRYAKLTGNSAAFDLHRNLQFGVAGASIAGGMLAYLFMDDVGSDPSHKWCGTALVVLYVVQCAVGYWARRTPEQHRTRVQRVVLAGLGACIVLLAYYEAWLGFVAAGDSPLLWSILFVVVPPLYLLGVLVIQRQYGSTQAHGKGEYVALDSRAPNDEVEDGEGHIVATRLRL